MLVLGIVKQVERFWMVTKLSLLEKISTVLQQQPRVALVSQLKLHQFQGRKTSVVPVPQMFGLSPEFCRAN